MEYLIKIISLIVAAVLFVIWEKWHWDKDESRTKYILIEYAIWFVVLSIGSVVEMLLGYNKIPIWYSLAISALIAVPAAIIGWYWHKQRMKSK